MNEIKEEIKTFLDRNKETSGVKRYWLFMKKFGKNNIEKLENHYKTKLSVEEIFYIVEHDLGISEIHCNFCGRKNFDSRYGFMCKKICPSTLEKKRKTCLKKYGVSNPAKNEKVKEKIKSKLHEIYADDKKKEKIIQKRKTTCLKKYNVENYSKTEECKSLLSATNKNNSQKRNEKIKKTCLKKYGVENVLSKNSSIRRKLENKWMKKYGTDNPLKNSKIQYKSKETLMKKYQVDNPFKIKEIYEKAKETKEKFLLKEYGVKHYSQINLSENALQSYKDVDFFRRIVEENNFSVKNIANFLNVNSTTVLNWSKKHNLHYWLVKNSTSFPQVKIAEKIQKDFNVQIKLNTRKIIYPYEIDIYLPKYGIGIEYHGLFWHSVLNLKDKLYHYKKYLKSTENNIILIQIFEDEWKNGSEEIMKKIEMILNNNIKSNIELFIMEKMNNIIVNNCFCLDSILIDIGYKKTNMIKPKKWFTDYEKRYEEANENCIDLIYDAGLSVWNK